MIELRNATDAEFVDISSELERTYLFLDDSITIILPQWLSVSASGGHRILDSRDICWYISPKWLAIQWTVADNKPHFVK